MSTALTGAPNRTARSRNLITGKGGIQRAGYTAHRSPDPAGAAAFAVDHMGLSLVHVDNQGRHYLAAEGLDPFSLVFVPGDVGIDHVSFIVHDLEALDAEEARLRETGVEVKRVDPNPLWRSGPALRVISPAGHAVHITPGVPTDVPMASLVIPQASPPAPIVFDHIAIGTTDVEEEMEFATQVLGLRESARVDNPEHGTVLGFCRAHTLFHCYTVVSLPSKKLHHYQFTLKNREALMAAYESMRDGGEVDVVWGPVRHGPGHNIAFYFRDHDGSFVEYSVEEEIILDNDAYVARHWSSEDPMFTDEWGSAPPQIFFV